MQRQTACCFLEQPQKLPVGVVRKRRKLGNRQILPVMRLDMRQRGGKLDDAGIGADAVRVVEPREGHDQTEKFRTHHRLPAGGMAVVFAVEPVQHVVDLHCLVREELQVTGEACIPRTLRLKDEQRLKSRCAGNVQRRQIEEPAAEHDVADLEILRLIVGMLGFLANHEYIALLDRVALAVHHMDSMSRQDDHQLQIGVVTVQIHGFLVLTELDEEREALILGEGFQGHSEHQITSMADLSGFVSDFFLQSDQGCAILIIA